MGSCPGTEFLFRIKITKPLLQLTVSHCIPVPACLLALPTRSNRALLPSFHEFHPSLVAISSIELMRHRMRIIPCLSAKCKKCPNGSEQSVGSLATHLPLYATTTHQLAPSARKTPPPRLPLPARPRQLACLLLLTALKSAVLLLLLPLLP